MAAPLAALACSVREYCHPLTGSNRSIVSVTGPADRGVTLTAIGTVCPGDDRPAGLPAIVIRVRVIVRDCRSSVKRPREFAFASTTA